MAANDIVAQNTPDGTTEFHGEPEDDYNPAIPICINTKWRGKPTEDEHALGDAVGWKRTTTTPRAIMDAAVTKGQAFTAALGDARYISKKTGKPLGLHRETENFAALCLPGVDFDAGTSADDVLDRYPLARDYGSFIYHTASHTPEAPRCRLVFCLQTPITEAEAAGELVRALIYHFTEEAPDPSTRDAVRTWYGAPGKPSVWLGGMLGDEQVAQLLADYRASPGYTQHAPAGPPDSAKVGRACERVRRVLKHAGITYTEADYQGGRKFVLSACPFNPEDEPHPDDHAAAVVVHGDGRIGATCHHSRCQTRIQESGRSAWSLLKYLTDFERPPVVVGMPPDAYDGTPTIHVYTNGDRPHEDGAEAAPAPPDAEPEPFDPFAQDVRPVDLGRLGEYVNLMHDLTGAPKSFHELVGLTALAAVLGNASLPVSWAGERGLRPNLYGCIIAPSSAFHKTTALRKAHSILPYDQLENCARLPGQFTEEGLTSALSKTPAGIIVRDEIGMLFASHRRKHLATVPDMLTQVYDGDTFAKVLASGAFTVSDPYLCIVGATTPASFFDSVREVDWDSGFLPRWLFVLEEGEPDWDHEAPMYASAHRDAVKRLGDWMRGVSPTKELQFHIDTEDYRRWQQWRKEIRKAAYEGGGGDRAMAILERYATYSLKFAMLLAVARGAPWGTIPGACVDDGIQLAKNYLAQVGRLFARQRAAAVDGSKLQRIFKLIKDWPGSEAAAQARRMYPTRRLVGQFAHMPADVRDRAIDMLLERGALMEETDGRTIMLRAAVDALPVGRL